MGILRGKERDHIFYAAANARVFITWTTYDLASVPNVSQADLDALKITETAPKNGLLVIGATYPKLIRVKKVLIRKPKSPTQQGSISTFRAYNAAATAAAAGWRDTETATIPAVAKNARYVTGLAELSNNLIYMQKSILRNDWDTYATDLGLIDPATISTASERERLVFEPTLPQCARGELNLYARGASGSFQGTVSMPVSHSAIENARDNGWKVEEEQLKYADVS